MDRRTGYSNKKSAGSYITSILLFIVIAIIVLTMFNLDLFYSYINRIDQQVSFFGFLGLIYEYVCALIQHTLSLVG